MTDEIKLNKKQGIIILVLLFIIIFAGLTFNLIPENNNEINKLRDDLEKMLNYPEYLQERLKEIGDINITNTTTIKELKEFYLENEIKGREELEITIEKYCPDTNKTKAADKIEFLAFNTTIITSRLSHGMGKRLLYTESTDISIIKHYYNWYSPMAGNYLKMEIIKICEV